MRRSDCVCGVAARGRSAIANADPFAGLGARQVAPLSNRKSNGADCLYERCHSKRDWPHLGISRWIDCGHRPSCLRALWRGQFYCRGLRGVCRRICRVSICAAICSLPTTHVGFQDETAALAAPTPGTLCVLIRDSVSSTIQEHLHDLSLTHLRPRIICGLDHRRAGQLSRSFLLSAPAFVALSPIKGGGAVSSTFILP